MDEACPREPVHRIDWSQALAEHGRWLRIAVLARLGDRQSVDEVMQEVALAAISQRAPISDVSKIGPWLHRLAIRYVLLHRRKCGRARRLTERYANRTTGGDEQLGGDPLDWLIRDERIARIRSALDLMPARETEILMLKYVERWSYRELAEHLGISVSAVEARLHRGRCRLREQLVQAEVIEVLK